MATIRLIFCGLAIVAVTLVVGRHIEVNAHTSTLTIVKVSSVFSVADSGWEFTRRASEPLTFRGSREVRFVHVSFPILRDLLKPSVSIVNEAELRKGGRRRQPKRPDDILWNDQPLTPSSCFDNPPCYQKADWSQWPNAQLIYWIDDGFSKFISNPLTSPTHYL